MASGIFSQKTVFRNKGFDKSVVSHYNLFVIHGPVAQLGAHHIRIVGVVGSNPIRSTKKGAAFAAPFCFIDTRGIFRK